jgi:hypothetical protein
MKFKIFLLKKNSLAKPEPSIYFNYVLRAFSHNLRASAAHLPEEASRPL